MEIGSEFWKYPKQFIQDNEEIYLSGRTALDIIVKDAVENYGITSALLPSYCCHTMIDPFVVNDIPVRFYEVYVDECGHLTANVPTPKENEILYIMKYFGDTDLSYTGEGQMLEGWSTTVEDLTHSCFDSRYKTKAKYWFTSYRKWFAADGIAVAGKRGGNLKPPRKGKNAAYCELRNKAYVMKAKFMDGQAADKQIFLNIFSEAEELLSKDYREYAARPDTVIDLCSLMTDIDQIREKRRKNAEILLERLSVVKDIRLFSDFESPSKCPLFVPILVGNDKRDALRKYLIDREIYCPVHWPLSDQHIGLSDRTMKIYGEELSLVCDQRYSVEDMRRIAETVASFFKYVES